MNIGQSSGDPRAEFYVRETTSSVIAGPYPKYHADLVARKLSDESQSGYAQVVTLVGADDRPGDPAQDSVLFVVYVYIRGRKLFGGRAATYQASKPQ